MNKTVDTTKNLTPFTHDRQPTSEQLKKGWERRREAQKILDEFMKQGEMTYKEIKDLLDDIKAHPENHTLREVKIANYLMSTKYTVDWLDRHVSKAPIQTDLTSGGDKIEGITVNFIENKKDGDESDSSPEEDNIGPEDI